MRRILELTYLLEDGNEFRELFPCKSAKDGLKKVNKRMQKKYMTVGPVSIETDGIVVIGCKSHSVH